RAIEHSAEKLRRLAAASFARGWLEYLIEDHAAGTSSALRELIEPLLEEGNQGSGSDSWSAPELESALDDIQARLLALDYGQSDWPAMVRTRCDQLVGEAKVQLTRRVLEAGQSGLTERLSGLRSAIETAVSSMLTGQTPATVGAVLADIVSLS